MEDACVPFSRALLVQGPKGFQAPKPRPTGLMKASEWERKKLEEEQTGFGTYRFDTGQYMFYLSCACKSYTPENLDES
eukprot:s80_g10.t1